MRSLEVMDVIHEFHALTSSIQIQVKAVFDIFPNRDMLSIVNKKSFPKMVLCSHLKICLSFSPQLVAMF